MSGLALNIFLILISVSVSIKMVAADNSYVLTQEQWSQPKRVETVLQMSAINRVLSDFSKSPGSQLLILYPGGDEGTLWAHELKAWLVSLGLSSRHIELQPGSGEDAIEMQVVLPLSGIIEHNQAIPEHVVRQE